MAQDYAVSGNAQFKVVSCSTPHGGREPMRAY